MSADLAVAPVDDELPELAAVPWRRRASAESLARRARGWLAWTTSLTVPFCGTGIGLIAVEPWTAPLALLAFVQAWALPELYAHRGAIVLRPRRRRHEQEPEAVAQGLLGDLLDHDARDLQRATGLALERGRLGVWLVGEAGALLVPPGGRRVHCFCVAVKDPALPPSDRIAHLLLALRTDEEGFATVANHAFAGMPWRVRRRLAARQRAALGAGVAAARAAPA
jgi:hypothetical protein